MTDHDLFVSYAHADAPAVGDLVSALTAAGLHVWLDESEIPTFGAIAERIARGLSRSKAFLAYYSKAYPARRACQYELTAAFVAAIAHNPNLDRLLVVNPETSDLHIHPIDLRNTKYLAAPTTPGALAGAAATIAAHLSGIAGSLGEPGGLAPPQWFPRRGTGSTRFVGRIDKMWEIHSKLHVAHAPFAATRVGAAVAQVVGLGGVGKSLLAEEYALRFGAAYPGGIFWVRAFANDHGGQLDALRHDQLVAIAAQLKLPPADSPAAVEAALREHFEQANQSGLWVVDDLPSGLSADQAQSWLAPHPILKTLITTRSREYGLLAEQIDLGVLPDADAYSLLTGRVPPDGEVEESAAQSLVRALGSHALALDVAGAALVSYEGDTPYQVFVRELEIPNQDSLELASELADTLPNGHETSIARTLLGSIRAAAEPARDVLRLASMFASAPIPEPLLTVIPDTISGPPVRQRALVAFRVAARDLLRFSLAEKHEDGGWIVHTLIARAMRYAYGSDARTAALRRAAVEALCRWLSDLRARDLPAASELAHARTLASTSDGYGAINLLQLVAHHDELRGSYAAAEAGWRAVLSRLEAMQQPEQVSLAIQNNLAVTLRKAGDAKQARDIQMQIVARKRELLGATHHETIASLDNLGATLSELGDYDGAIRTHSEAMRLFDDKLGAEHPDTLVAMSNLGGALRRSGKLRNAFELYNRLLALRTKVLGPRHPGTLRTAEALAITISELGHPADALPMLVSAAEGLVRVRGLDDPQTLTLRQNLARALMETGLESDGRKLATEVLDAQRRVLGKTHPDTLVTLELLAHAVARSGERDAIRTLRDEALEALRELDASLGPRHPRTTAGALMVYGILEGDPEERAHAVGIVDAYLEWLLKAPPAELEAGQKSARDQFAQTSDGMFRSAGSAQTS